MSICDIWMSVQILLYEVLLQIKQKVNPYFVSFRLLVELPHRHLEFNRICKHLSYT